MTGTFSAYSNILKVFVNLLHISQPSMINPGLSTLTCLFTQAPRVWEGKY